MCNLPIRRRVSNFCCNFYSQTVFLVLVTKIRLLVTFRVIWVKLAQRQCYIRFDAANYYYAFFFDLNRLKISTPKEYIKFKNGVIGADTEVVHIEPNAYPNVFRDVKHFANALNVEIRFRDPQDNIIHLFPWNKMVKAFVWNGNNLLQYLPTDYKDYEIQYNFKSNLTDADIQYIFELKNAERICIGNDFNVNGNLPDRIKGIGKLQNLKKFTVEINRPDNLNVQLSSFVESSPYLQEVEIVLPYAMSQQERSEYTHNQIVPNGWRLQRSGQFLVFQRK